MPRGRSKRSSKRRRPALARRTRARGPARGSRAAARPGTPEAGVWPEPLEQLPAHYGDTLLIAQARDPHWLHAYWEAPESVWAAARRQLGVDGNPVLRVYELAEPVFQPATIRRWFDVALVPYADDWHVEVPQPATWWCLELGLRGADGRFVPMIRSNLVETPADHPSDELDETWGVRDAVGGQFARATSPASPLWQR